MSLKMFEEIPENEREAMLEANCVHPEEKPVKKYFEQEEMTEMRRQFFENALTIRKSNEVLKKAKDLNAIEIKEPTKNNEYLRESLRAGYVEVKQQVYLFDDQEKGVMNTYDCKGNFVESRLLTPEERNKGKRIMINNPQLD